MKLYGGNTKRIIQRHAYFGLDGVSYRWESGLFRIKTLLSLKVGDIAFIPYNKTWGTVEKVEPHITSIYGRADLEHPNFKQRYIKGWYVNEVYLTIRDSDNHAWYVYDVEHWNSFAAGYQPHDPEMVKQFNRQVGLPEDYDLPSNWQRWY